MSTHKFSQMANLPASDMVDEVVAADFLGISFKTLQGWRMRKKGPRYYKLSNRIRYSLEDLRAYRDSCAVEPESAR